MAIYLVKCPSCGSATELNDEKDSGFCTECGAKIDRDEAELYVPDPAPGAEAAPAEPEAPAEAESEAPAEIAAPEAEAPAVPALTLEPAPDPAFAVDDGAPAPLFSEAAETAHAAVLNNAEQVSWLVMNQPQPLDSIVFKSSDECAAYVNTLHSLLLGAAERYAKMNHAEEATCLDFLDKGIAYCDYLDVKRLRFLAGTHEEKGKTVEDYGSFPVSKDVLKDLKQIREDFVEAYNGFFRPKIAAAKAALDETKEKIKALPAGMRFYHAFCTPVMGILTAILTAVGVFAIVKSEGGVNLLNLGILIVGAALFITWAVTTVIWLLKGASVRQLYKAAERQATEARTFRAKLKG